MNIQRPIAMRSITMRAYEETLVDILNNLDLNRLDTFVNTYFSDDKVARWNVLTHNDKYLTMCQAVIQSTSRFISQATRDKAERYLRSIKQL